MSISNRKRFEILKRDGFTCQYCGKKGATVRLEVDHIEPQSKGGSDDDENLITACFECNRGKSDIQVINENKKESEADYIYRLVDFPADYNHAIEMIESYLHEAIITCLEMFPRYIVCMAVIIERDNIYSDCDYVEYDAKNSVISTLEDHCRLLQEHWNDISPYKLIRLISVVEHESKCEAYYRFNSEYKLTPKIVKSENA
jgi:hypothetical protein